mmetsp:Transcript_46722/g.79657  ORF Transcript_46722/g.79657 Transcript_46722/m.79657 type:complete len:97 (-) Transcript_46722:23-313(-)
MPPIGDKSSAAAAAAAASGGGNEGDKGTAGGERARGRRSGGLETGAEMLCDLTLEVDLGPLSPRTSVQSRIPYLLSTRASSDAASNSSMFISFCLL